MSLRKMFNVRSPIYVYWLSPCWQQV